MHNTEGLVQRSPMKLNIPSSEQISSQKIPNKDGSAKMDSLLRYGTLVILVLQTTATVKTLFFSKLSLNLIVYLKENCVYLNTHF